MDSHDPSNPDLDALREVAGRYYSLLDAAADHIFVIADGRIQYLNAAAARLLNRTEDRAVGELLESLFPPEVVKEQRAALAEVLATGQPVNQTMHLLLHGREMWLDTTLAPLTGPGAGPREVMGIARDVTERNRAEAERARLAMAIEQAAEMIVVTDAQAGIQYVNPAFEETTGYKRADILGKNPRVLQSGMQGEPFYRKMWATISGGKTWSGRFVNRRSDGSLYTTDARISPVRDAAGVIQSYVSVARDITQELSLEAQLLQAQKMEGIGRLAGGVAHDFNNLLSVILSYTEFAIEGAGENRLLKDDLLEVKKASERAAELTRQLLAFSRKQLLQPLPLSFNEVAQGVEKMLRRIVGEDIELVQVLASDLGVVVADPGQIEQVLMNLVVNARDAMPDGGTLTIETANVELDAEYAASHPGVLPGAYVMLAVTDSGVGMDQGTMTRIFDPFFTTKALGKGTGLGLSTVYGIVKQSGGSIWVYSELGRGTTFKVYLRRDWLAKPTTSRLPPSIEPRRLTGTETILVAEDEEALRKVTKRLLEAAGYAVLSASDADEALRIAAQHDGTIHLLLTDVIMPRTSGTALARELSKTRPALKVLYMSGYTDDAIVRQGALEVGTHFISKPFVAADLARMIRDLLDDGSSDPDRKPVRSLEAELAMAVRALDAAPLRAIPPALAAKLHDAVTAARYDEMLALIEILRLEHPDVADELRRRMEGFDYDGVQELLSS